MVKFMTLPHPGPHGQDQICEKGQIFKNLLYSYVWGTVMSPTKIVKFMTLD